MRRDTSIVDDVDREIIYRLQLDGRSSFRTIARDLGISEQTVARRYRRLVREGVLRVRGLLNPVAPGYLEWMVRVQCRPAAAGPIAEALAKRADVVWVSLTSGGSEVLCTVRARDEEQRDALLLERIPRTTQVVSLAAHSYLHRFDDRSPGWSAYRTVAPDRRTAPDWRPPPNRVQSIELDETDLSVLSVLAADGRATFTDIAKAARCSLGHAAARLSTLRDSGALRIEVEVSPEPLGFYSIAYLWMAVAPADLVALGEMLAAHDEVAFCAAVTGSVNLVAAVICRDSADLYRYLTGRLAELSAVRQFEVSPMVRRIKQAGSLVEDHRLIGSSSRAG